MRSCKGWSSCGGAIFGHLSVSFGAAAQHGGSSNSLNTLWEVSIFEYNPPQTLKQHVWLMWLQLWMLRAARSYRKSLNTHLSTWLNQLVEVRFMNALLKIELHHRRLNLNRAEMKIHSADAHRFSGIRNQQLLSTNSTSKNAFSCISLSNSLFT